MLEAHLKGKKYELASKGVDLKADYSKYEPYLKVDAYNPGLLYCVLTAKTIARNVKEAERYLRLFLGCLLRITDTGIRMKSLS